MNIDHPTAAQIPGLRALWKEAFGDSDAFLDVFFSIAYDSRRCRCICTEGSVEAVLYWFDVSCRGQKFAYIYAVATAAAVRGKGRCKALMADTAELLKHQGYQGALLVPQDDGLRQMYGKMGYLPAGSIDEFFCAAGDAPAVLTELTPRTYADRRSPLVPEGSVALGTESLAFLSSMARFFAGRGFLAAVSREQEHLRILEYLGDREQIPALIAALGRTEATVRGPGTGMPFAMYLPLTDQCPKPEYYPFAFD